MSEDTNNADEGAIVPEETTDNVENFPDADTASSDDNDAAEMDISADEPLTPDQIMAGLVEENAELKDKLLRAVAETENVRRRAQRDKEDMAKYAISNFARDILSVADNMRRAIDSVDEATRKEHGTIENLLIGVEMTERDVLATFERMGIKRMDPVGMKFDPNFHEAMFEYDDVNQPAGSVGQVIEAGYMLHSRALRPAKVGITKGGPKLAAPGASNAPSEEASADTAAYENKPDSTSDGVGGNLNEEL